MPDLDPPIELLFGATDGQDLPDRLAESYGSGLGLPDRVVYANFVGSIDGIVAIGELGPSSSVISGRDPGDRFVMALLRAAADVVLVGAGTFRDHGGPWTAAASFPDAGEAFAELRGSEGRAPEPPLAIVTASGALEPKEGALLDGTIVLTTEKGAATLDGTGADVVVLGDDEELDGARIVDRLHRRGFARILTEGGPQLMAQLVEARVVDELFLTVSPVIAGEGGRPGERSTLTPGLELLPEDRRDAVLRSVRRRGSYLFLRYGLEGDERR
jgi:riboflavin biosynthesis pyrimidine reductase